MKKQDMAGLTDGPSGTVGLLGHPKPEGNEGITSKATGSYGDMVGPAGPTKITTKMGGAHPEFTRPGGVTEV